MFYETRHNGISGIRLILPGIILGLFTAPFLGIFVMGCQESLLKSLLFLIPLLIILPLSLPRYLRLLSLALNHKPALVLSPQALVDQIHRKNYAWTDIGEINYMPGGGKSTGSRVVVALRNGRHIELPHKLMGCTHTELIQSLQVYLRDFGQNT